MRRIREITDYPYPLIYLVGNSRETKSQLTREFLAEISGFVQGLGPSKLLLNGATDWLTDARAQGLLIHPYTFRADDSFPTNRDSSFTAELNRYLWKLKVDGVFTDFPDLVRRSVDQGPK